jgi:hypothetical protein
VGDVDPVGHAYPGVQAPTQVGDVCPGADPKDPGRQGAVQAAEVRPGSAPYTPRGHGVQLPAPGREYVPAGHTTAVALALPAGQAWPSLQLPEQPALLLNAPSTAPNRPAGHGVHVPAPNEEYVPAGHSTVVALTLPAGHMCPSAQEPAHPTVPLGAPTNVPNRPAGHGAHVPAPASEYVPAGHMPLHASATLVLAKRPGGQGVHGA